ncbi:hypothetical protein PSCFBP3800_04439 [Pseudomonas syringae group genomosp. 3]|uniref:Uncharacterized protein n=1 Tax=Pseudomonas syringae group genomosp. 3 TaxID=251701 RepID=A0A2K4WIC9_9PSED|nr:hypothetical protein CFBP6411_04303 [Pseudomonas syringae group genomosp. 3]SPF19895.1 hypothetical protein PSCFBP3800_04439 [Pseudomonas syringae group genomosp. 3]
MSANCREPAAKPAASVHQIQPRWLVLGPLRSPSRTSPLPRPSGRSALRVRTGRRFLCPRYPGFRRSGLVRELPGTGSKTSRLGAPDTTKVAGFGFASQPIADKSAPTPFGQKRVACADGTTLPLSANCRGPAAKPAASVHQIQPRWLVLGPLRSPSRTSPRPSGRSALRVRTGRRFTCPRTAGNRQQNQPPRCIRYNQGGWFLVRFAAHRGQVRSHALRAEARCVCGRGDASFVRELPGTGSKTGAYGVRNDNLNYRATLCVACSSGRSASDLEPAVHWCVATIGLTRIQGRARGFKARTS